MPANVVEMFSVNEAPWHLGVETTKEQTHVLTEYPGREEAMKLAGHFEVEEGPVFAGPGERINGFKRLFNAETRETVFVVNDGYEVIQANEMWDLVEVILDTDKDVKWETAGVLDHGVVMWVMARVDRPFFISGDPSPIFPYLSATTTHNGKGSMVLRNMQTRIVCMNTHHAAERETEQSGREFTFRHTKGVHDRIEEARKVLAGAGERVSAFQELAEEIAKLGVSDNGIDKFLNEFIQAPPAYLTSDRVKANIDRERGKILGILNSETVPETVRNTGYGLYMAGVEYLDHKRVAKSKATLFKRSILRNDPYKKALIPMIRRIAEEDEQKVLVTV